MIRVYDAPGKVIETHELHGRFQRLVNAGLAIVQLLNELFALWSKKQVPKAVQSAYSHRKISVANVSRCVTRSLIIVTKLDSEWQPLFSRS